MNLLHFLRAFNGIVIREGLRFVHQKERLVAALVRPMLWLIVFGAGLRSSLGELSMPLSEAPVSYETYIIPGLAAMILLFSGMQSSLSMVYDREMGSMRVLLTSPLPRWFVVLAKLLASTLVAMLQVYAFLLIARLYGIQFPWTGFLTALPALIVSGMALGAVGLFLSSLIRQLENFAGVMNFVIFPAFFLSSALYPLENMQASSSQLYWLCKLNPFNHAVELIRFALYGKLNLPALAVTAGTLVAFAVLAVISYDPRHSIVKRQIA